MNKSAETEVTLNDHADRNETFDIFFVGDYRAFTVGEASAFAASRAEFFGLPVDIELATVPTNIKRRLFKVVKPNLTKGTR